MVTKLSLFIMFAVLWVVQSQLRAEASKADELTAGDEQDEEEEEEEEIEELSKRQISAARRRMVETRRPRLIPDPDASWRERQFGSVNLELYGLGYGAGSGMSAAKYLSKDYLLEVSFIKYSLTFWGMDNKFNVASVEPRLKVFFSDSFYSNIGLMHMKVSQVSTSVDSEQEIMYRWLGGSLAIGNRWQWEKIVIGCDWFGVSKPFTVFSHDATETSGSVANLEKFKKKAKKEAWLKHYRLMQFYVGFSF